MKKPTSAFIFLFFISVCSNLNAQYIWTQKANFGGMVRYAVSAFNINGLGYFVAGLDVQNSIYYNDCWQYDPVTDSWTQMATMNGVVRYGASGFAIGNFGYVGCGWGAVQLKDFHKYDAAGNTWSNIPDLPGPPRYTALSVTDGVKGYVGLGYAPLQDDFYAYDPVLNSWSTLTNFPGGPRQAAASFCLNGIIYVCGGADANITYNDMWAYDPATNNWTSKAPIPGQGRDGSVCFALNGLGFVGSGYIYPSGYNNDFYMYDATSNSWTQGPTWPATLRIEARSFVIGNLAYAGCGYWAGSGLSYNDFWSFGLGVLAPAISIASSDTVWCDKAAVDFFDLSTNNPSSWQWYFPGAAPDTSTLQNPTGIYYASPGSYDVTLVACNGGGCDSITYPAFIKEFNPPPAPIVTQSYDTLWSSVAYSYKWYNVAQPGNLLSINQYLILYQPGSYYVIVTDSNGCETPSAGFVFTAINEKEDAAMVSFYDQASQNIIVDLVSNPGNKNFKIELIDNSGRKVYSCNDQTGNSKIVIPVSEFYSGVYFVRVFNDEQSHIQKVIKINER